MPEMKEIIAKVETALTDARIHASVYQRMDLPVVAVEINWGDWKHDHLHADLVVERLGGLLVSTQLTEEDCSDCYSAVHNYIFH